LLPLLDFDAVPFPQPPHTDAPGDDSECH